MFFSPCNFYHRLTGALLKRYCEKIIWKKTTTKTLQLITLWIKDPAYKDSHTSIYAFPMVWGNRGTVVFNSEENWGPEMKEGNVWKQGK